MLYRIIEKTDPLERKLGQVLEEESNQEWWRWEERTSWGWHTLGVGMTAA